AARRDLAGLLVNDVLHHRGEGEDQAIADAGIAALLVLRPQLKRLLRRHSSGLVLGFPHYRTPYSRGKFAAGLKFRLARMTSAYGLEASSAEARNRIRSNPQRDLKILTNPPAARHQPGCPQARLDARSARGAGRCRVRRRPDLRAERQRGALEPRLA